MDSVTGCLSKPRKPGFWLARQHWAQMAADVDRRAPEEACGLVAASDGRSIAVFPIDNQLHSPVRFRMDPRQQVKRYFEILEKGWDLAAIYHSHPHPDGPLAPSPTDIAEAAYPEAVSLIWSRAGQVWKCRGYRIRDGLVSKVTIRLFS